MLAAACWNTGRIEAAVRYADAGQMVIGSGGHEVPFGSEGALGIPYTAIGQPERCVEWCRVELAHGRDSYAFTTASLVTALTMAGSPEQAMAVANDLIDAAEATRNPCALSFALLAYAYAFLDDDPARALEALRRGLVIAQDSGNRANETHLALALFRLEAQHGEPLAALEYATLAIRRYHDSGNSHQARTALAVLAAFFDWLSRYEQAATIAGFAFNPLTAVWIPEIGTAITHLRDVLGDHAYESLARKGETMTTADVAAYAYHQIDQARAELNAVSK